MAAMTFAGHQPWGNLLVGPAELLFLNAYRNL